MAKEDILAKVKKDRERDANARRNWDWAWLGYDLFKRGYMFARYSRATNTVVYATRTKVRVPINLVSAHKRSVQNQIIAFRPKWEVTMFDPSEEGAWNGKMSGRLLDTLFYNREMRSKVRGVVDHGLTYSVGVWKVEWNKNLRGGQGDVQVSIVDPFDLYIDARATGLDDAEHVTLTVAKTIEEVKANENYSNTEDLSGDNEVALSEYKKFRESAIRNLNPEEMTDTVLLNETWIKQRKGPETKMRIVTWLEDRVLRDQKDVDEEEFPYEIYKAHDDALSIYSESWLHHLIPVNRVINALESHVFEYNHLMARGRYVMDKNAGAGIITNENGTIIEKNRGFEVRQLEMHPLPSTVTEQIVRMRMILEDLSGAHDISFGRLPTGIRSGVGIAELKQNDASNQGSLTDSLESFFSSAGRKILNIYSRKLTTKKLVDMVGATAKDYFFIVGEEGKGEIKTGEKLKYGKGELPVYVIGRPKSVRVTVGSWLAYTKEAQKKQLEDWFKIGLIDQETCLRHMEMGDVEGIMERTAKERFEGRGALQPGQAPEGKAPATPAGPTPTGGVAASPQEEALANEENVSFLRGQAERVSPEDDHGLHIEIHTPVAEQGSPEAIQHIQDHQKYLQAG